jgi:tetratricopeptide (TPR) repeat protein
MMSSLSKNKQMLLIYSSLTIATLLAFWQVKTCEFIYFDDPFYVTENAQVRNGITLEGIRWAFTTGHVANWHPLTWISHMVDVQFFGLKPAWHHATNLLFHLANTLLLFFVLHRMTKARWESAFVAALFALHPLRKDVLSTFFWILTMGAYCSYVERPGLQRYLIVVLFFALGLMSKPMLVTLPFVLLLLDYWPLQRFQQKESDQKIGTAVNGDKQKGTKKRHTAGEEAKAATPAGSRYQWALMIRPLLWEKVPLFALTILSSIVTYSVQQKGGAIQSYPLSIRISNAFVSYITYIGKTIWPNDLAVSYSYPLSLPAWQVFGAVLLLMAVTITVIRKARSAPYLAMGWLWYAGTLVPVIGIVQAGLQARADRYTYVPLIGLFIMAAWGIPKLSKNWQYRKEALFALSIAVLLCFCLVTWTQVGYWRNSIMLFDHALDVTDNNYTAYFNRGAAYSHLGNYRQAISDYEKAILIYPIYANAYHNRGIAYANLGNYQHAIEDYDKTLELSPTYAEPYNNRAYAYLRLGSTGRAIEDLKKAARLGYKDAQNSLKNQGLEW